MTRLPFFVFNILVAEVRPVVLPLSLSERQNAIASWGTWILGAAQVVAGFYKGLSYGVQN